MAAPTFDDRDAGMRALLARLGELPKLRLTVGVHGVDDGALDDRSNVHVAATHEFGNPARRIPKRSWLRAGIDQNRSEILAEMDGVIDRVAQGAQARAEVQALGLQVVEVLRERMRVGINPPLSPATVERRKARSRKLNDRWSGKFTPLIDTGQLIQSIKAYVAREAG